MNCTYCGKPAGLFHSKHKECDEAHAAGIAQLTTAIDQAFASETATDSLPQLVGQVAGQSYIPASEQRALLVAGWARALATFVGDGVLDESEEARLAHFRDRFALSKDELNQSHSYERMVKAAALREVMHGEIPKESNHQWRFAGQPAKG